MSDEWGPPKHESLTCPERRSAINEVPQAPALHLEADHHVRVDLANVLHQPVQQSTFVEQHLALHSGPARSHVPRRRCPRGVPRLGAVQCAGWRAHVPAAAHRAVGTGRRPRNAGVDVLSSVARMRRRGRPVAAPARSTARSGSSDSVGAPAAVAWVRVEAGVDHQHVREVGLVFWLLAVLHDGQAHALHRVIPAESQMCGRGLLHQLLMCNFMPTKQDTSGALKAANTARSSTSTPHHHRDRAVATRTWGPAAVPLATRRAPRR